MSAVITTVMKMFPFHSTLSLLMNGQHCINMQFIPLLLSNSLNESSVSVPALLIHNLYGIQVEN